MRLAAHKIASLGLEAGFSCNLVSTLGCQRGKAEII